MSRLIALLLVTLGGPVIAADSTPVRLDRSAPRLSTTASRPGIVTAAAAREIDRLVRATASEARTAQPGQGQKKKGWMARHPSVFGALVGFAGGCLVGASQVGGSEDHFFNALDEFACPVAGGIGAGAGALVGLLVK